MSIYLSILLSSWALYPPDQKVCVSYLFWQSSPQAPSLSLQCIIYLIFFPLQLPFEPLRIRSFLYQAYHSLFGCYNNSVHCERYFTNTHTHSFSFVNAKCSFFKPFILLLHLLFYYPRSSHRSHTPFSFWGKPLTMPTNNLNSMLFSLFLFSLRLSETTTTDPLCHFFSRLLCLYVCVSLLHTHFSWSDFFTCFFFFWWNTHTHVFTLSILMRNCNVAFFFFTGDEIN